MVAFLKAKNTFKMKRKREQFIMKKSIFGRPEGSIQIIVLCVLRRQGDWQQKNLRPSKLQASGEVKCCLQRRFDDDWYWPRGKQGAKSNSPDTWKLYSDAVYLRFLKETRLMYSPEPKPLRKTLHSYFQERPNHWKYLEVGALSQRNLSKSRDNYWPNQVNLTETVVTVKRPYL